MIGSIETTIPAIPKIRTMHTLRAPISSPTRANMVAGTYRSEVRMHGWTSLWILLYATYLECARSTNHCLKESCAKEPIENHWLKKLQLCFHLADGNDLSEANLIESYSLTFKHDKGRISPRLSTRSKTAPTDEPSMTLFEGRHTLGKMVDKLFHNLYECDKRGNRLRLYPLPGKLPFTLNFITET